MTTQSNTATFTFKVPAGHPDAGKEIEQSFSYPQVETDDEALAWLSEKEMSLVELVNDKMKSNARSNAYQAALLPYRPSTVSAADIQERAIRDLIRLGMSEDQARNLVTSATAVKSEE